MTGEALRQQRKAIKQEIKQKQETKYNQIGTAKKIMIKLVM